MQIERQEKAQLQQQATKLAEGVKTLASKSGELVQEIRDNRPLASNTIFNDFVTNAVEAQFTASRPGMFGGESTKARAAKTILVSDGTNTFSRLSRGRHAVAKFWIPPTDWQGLTASLQRDGGGSGSAVIDDSPHHRSADC